MTNEGRLGGMTPNIITIFNNKGGVGKTTLTFHLAQLYMAVDGTRARLEERMWNSHLMPSVQGQNDGAGQVRAA
jgi:hypothetical protein